MEALLSNLGRQQLKRLQTLNLERNQIDDAGCTTLIAALGGTAWPYRLTGAAAARGPQNREQRTLRGR